MPPRKDDKLIEMSEPQRISFNTEFGFWLTTFDDQILDVVASLLCVATVQEPEEDGRALVEIADDHDPDEAWHWIRAELEEEIQFVELDPIWEEALKWL